MKKSWVILLLALLVGLVSFTGNNNTYKKIYTDSLEALRQRQLSLLKKIKDANVSTPDGIAAIKGEIAGCRVKLKGMDIWLRYLDPVAYKKMNGPLPVEWENEVFEKFEKPYKREGAGLSLAELYLEEKTIDKDSLEHLVQRSVDAVNAYYFDSVINQLDSFHHFFYCNRLYLLNLAALYTTGFECPAKERVIPELRTMIADVKTLYAAYDQSFPATPLTREYMALYDRMADFVRKEPVDIARFDHYHFIKDYVNPLFAMNQRMIAKYNAVSVSTNDFTLDNECVSIFDKSLYASQNVKGVYSMIDDTAVLGEIRAVGKKLFYDPILSGNNMRSCASCHVPKEFFTDTSCATNLNFDREHRLLRNTPSLVNVVYNHMLMLDGRHISLQGQGKDVMTNGDEMGSKESELVEKVMTCKEYRTVFNKLAKYTPEEKEISFQHITSAITFYYKDFSKYYSPFDEAMNNDKPLAAEAVRGFNLFMGKARCGTCHYVPQFSGVAPPYITSEFEVVGTPEDVDYHKLSRDTGRYKVNPAFETMRAFRTNTVRNSEHTKPYMHNGVFTTLEQVVDFYDGGGGAGHKLAIDNQTLSADSLKLTPVEKRDLVSFIHSLSERVIFEDPPAKLPVSSVKAYNERKTGGVY